MKHSIFFLLGISAWLCTTAQDPLPEEQLIVNWTLALESDLICYDIVIDGDAWYVNDQHDVFKSTDGGETWDDTPWPLGIVRNNTSVVRGIEASNGKLVVGALDNGYYVSNDAGSAYSATGPTGFGCASVSILSLDDGAFLGTMGGFQRGLYRLPNGSTSGWEKTFSGRDCGSLAHSGNFIFATDYGTSNGGMLASSDNGFSWNYIYSGSGGASPNSGCIWNDKLVFVTKDKRVFHHDIGSSSAVEVGASPIELNWVTHTSDGNILGLSHNESMAFLSTDGGLSWSGFSLPEANYYSSLREHNGEILLTTQGGLYRGYFDNVYAGCIDETACNFDEEANVSDGSCIPSGCMDPEACNYNDMAECEGEACDYSCPEIPVYVPTNGLVAWFPFNGNAIDESWNGHDAEVDGASLSTDRFGNSESAYVFDGNDRIFPSNPEGFPVAERTTSIWMKSNVEVTGGRALFGYGGGSCGSSWLLTYNNQGNQPYAYHSFELQGHCNAFATAAAMPSSEFENWHHIVLRTSVEGTDIFVDGVLTTQSSTFVNNTQPNCAVLGAVPSPGGACVYQDSANDLWSGLLDDFAIWNRALTNEEIESLYFSDFETGCTDSNACNFDAAATLDDGSCEYGCTYCGPGTSWDADAQICVVTTSPYLNEPGEAAILNPCYFDSNGNGLVEVTDLMNVLSVYGMACGDVPAAAFSCGNPVSYHGYDYETVLIGEQCWFAENLRSSSYQNGDDIPGDLSAADWELTNQNQSGACSIYGETDGSCAHFSPCIDPCDELASLEAFGKLYNWYAVNDGRNLCPSGWHVASDDEWAALEDDVVGQGFDSPGTALRSSSCWVQGNNGTDDVGFEAVPGGYRNAVVEGHIHFPYAGHGAYFWTASIGENSSEAWCRFFDHFDPQIRRESLNRGLGFSIRCVKD